MSATTESAKHEWEQAYRRLLDVSDPEVEERLARQIEAITTELRRRLGGAFTTRELAEVYAGADVWARHVLAEQGIRDWLPTVSLAEGAAFHLYARGATDFEP